MLASAVSTKQNKCQIVNLARSQDNGSLYKINYILICYWRTIGNWNWNFSFFHFMNFLLSAPGLSWAGNGVFGKELASEDRLFFCCDFQFLELSHCPLPWDFFKFYLSHCACVTAISFLCSAKSQAVFHNEAFALWNQLIWLISAFVLCQAAGKWGFWYLDCVGSGDGSSAAF